MVDDDDDDDDGNCGKIFLVECHLKRSSSQVTFHQLKLVPFR